MTIDYPETIHLFP